jgi:hypothetical protein
MIANTEPAPWRGRYVYAEGTVHRVRACDAHAGNLAGVRQSIAMRRGREDSSTWPEGLSLFAGPTAGSGYAQLVDRLAGAVIGDRPQSPLVSSTHGAGTKVNS